MLVLLDNASDAAQVRQLLPGSPGCLVIVTSRSKLTGLVATNGAVPMSLDVLNDVEACVCSPASSATPGQQPSPARPGR